MFDGCNRADKSQVVSTRHAPSCRPARNADVIFCLAGWHGTVLDCLFQQMITRKGSVDMQHARDFATFSSVLKARGAAAALAYLNAGVPHRFSGVYRIDAGNLRNVLLVDKEGEMRPAFLETVPMDASFCQFVVRDGLFRTNNSATDARLDGHPYQGVVVSYHAVPLVDPDRALVGTLSHFDLIERSIDDAEFELLYQAGHLFSDFIPP